uniref:Uncharacterized protein n=1 Tax=Caenorhabditis japonica TaxID=281687 RepID=A0A8R1IAK4_CAEJA
MFRELNYIFFSQFSGRLARNVISTQEAPFILPKTVNCGFLMMRQILMSAMESVTIPCKNASSAAKKGTNSKEALQGGGDGANPAFN